MMPEVIRTTANPSSFLENKKVITLKRKNHEKGYLEIHHSDRSSHTDCHRYQPWGYQLHLLRGKGSGIPVSCGIANTYTLAKVATWYAKRYDGYQGICVLEEEHVEKALRGLPVEEVWGVGWRTAPKMKQMGIVA